jgi:hypothetical protein
MNDIFCLCTLFIILWHNSVGNSSHSYSVFRMQKRVLCIMTKSGYRDSCRQLFFRTGEFYHFILNLYILPNAVTIPCFCTF